MLPASNWKASIQTGDSPWAAFVKNRVRPLVMDSFTKVGLGMAKGNTTHNVGLRVTVVYKTRVWALLLAVVVCMLH